MEESISSGQQMPAMAIPECDTVPETRDENPTLGDMATYLKVGKRAVYRFARKGFRRSSSAGFSAFAAQAGSLDSRKHQQDEAGGRVSMHQIGNRITFGKEPRGGSLSCQFP
jgi:hypothetical protein